MAFCRNCGTQIKEGAKFCPSCGTKFAESTAQPQQVYQQPAQQQQPAPQQSKNDFSRLLLVSIVLYAVPMITSFLLNTFHIYDIPYIYLVTSMLSTASFIVGICTIVKLKTMVAQSIFNTAIILLSIMAVIEFYYVIRNIIYIL
jgi:hypothetical protein